MKNDSLYTKIFFNAYADMSEIHTYWYLKEYAVFIGSISVVMNDVVTFKDICFYKMLVVCELHGIYV